MINHRTIVLFRGSGLANEQLPSSWIIAFMSQGHWIVKADILGHQPVTPEKGEEEEEAMSRVRLCSRRPMERETDQLQESGWLSPPYSRQLHCRQSHWLSLRAATVANRV